MARNLVSGSPGNAAARIPTDLSALASRSTAATARSLSLQTWAAVKPTNSPNIIPKGGNMPGETLLNERARSPTASAITTMYIPADKRYVKPKTNSAIHNGSRAATNQGDSHGLAKQCP